MRAYEEAVGLLDAMERERGGAGLGPVEWSEKGLLLDKMGRDDEAFAAFREAKRTLREPPAWPTWPKRPRAIG